MRSFLIGLTLFLAGRAHADLDVPVHSQADECTAATALRPPGGATKLGYGRVISPAIRGPEIDRLLANGPSDAGARNLPVLHFGTLALHGTAAEVALACHRLTHGLAHRYSGLKFKIIGDMGYEKASLENLVWIGKDAGVRLKALKSGFYIECWECRASDVIPALIAMGAAAAR